MSVYADRKNYICFCCHCIQQAYGKWQFGGESEICNCDQIDLKLVDTLYYKFIKNGPTSCLFPGNCLTSFSGSGAEQNFLVS